MENSSSSGVTNVNYTKILLISSCSVAISFAVYLLLIKKRKESSEYNAYEEKRRDFVEKIKDHELNYSGLMGAFDYLDFQPAKFQTKFLQKYFLPIGLPNVGNTCYMNALLQTLTGCPLFMDYVYKLFNTLEFSSLDPKSFIVFRLFKVLTDLNKGSFETNPLEIYQDLCSEFTQSYEQQDSHELLIYLQEKITKLTAKQIRQSRNDEGLASPDLFSSTASSESPLKEEEFEEEIKIEYPDKIYPKNDDNDFDQEESNKVELSNMSSNKFLKGSLQFKDIQKNKQIGLNPFGGIYLSAIKCTRCGPAEELHRYEMHYNLSLELKSTLVESLNQYFKGELIEDFSCIKCSLRTYLSQYPQNLNEVADPTMRIVLQFLHELKQTHDLDEETFVKQWQQFKSSSKLQIPQLKIDKLQSQIIKKFSISTAPKIMCFHLKRVQYSVDGQVLLNRSFVQFPEILDMSKIESIKSNNFDMENKYQLSGIIEHFGSAFGGHYVAYKRLFPEDSQRRDMWVVCDDSNVNIINKEQVLQRAAYMLFYEKINLDV